MKLGMAVIANVNSGTDRWLDINHRTCDQLPRTTDERSNLHANPISPTRLKLGVLFPKLRTADISFSKCKSIAFKLINFDFV